MGLGLGDKEELGSPFPKLSGESFGTGSSKTPSDSHVGTLKRLLG